MLFFEWAEFNISESEIDCLVHESVSTLWYYCCCGGLYGCMCIEMVILDSLTL